MKRRVQAELLDTLPPEDPAARRSRRDLQRINWWMGNHTALAAALKENFNGPRPVQITEIGAGDGHFLACVAQKLPAWTEVNATLLDRQPVISAATWAAFAQAGWQMKAMTSDVFDWAPETAGESVVVANLFLHHFEDARLAALLQTISRGAKLFIALEPRRVRWSGLVGLLLRLIGANAVTRHDGVISIRAGFTGREISALWPDQKNWQLIERRSGWFSHLFIARRINLTTNGH